jgi:hypothetical protein
MLTSRTLRPALAAAALLAASAGLRAAPQGFNAQEIRDLGRAIGKYVEKQGNLKDQSKLRDEMVSILEKAGKRIDRNAADPVQVALARTADLGKALLQSSEYKNPKSTGKVVASTADTPDGPVNYALWLPSDYKASNGPYPLLLIAPGMASGTKESKPFDPEQFLTEHWTEREVRAGAILVAVEMPEDSATWTEQRTPDGEPGGISALMFTYADVRNRYAVDRDRLYLVGRETGVAAVMNLASKYPQLFAGVIGRAGDAGTTSWQNFRNLPTFFQGGGAQASAFAEEIKKAGYDNCNLAPEAQPAEIWTWIQEHPRVANPSKITLVPGSPIPIKAYWVEVPPSEGQEGAIVTAEADKATNTIKIQGTGVRSVTVFFNDEIVDLSKPIKIVLNGEEQENQIRRSLDDLLELFMRGTNDAGKLYVATRTYDLPS